MTEARRDVVLKAILGVLFLAFVFVIKDSFEQRIVEVGESAPHFALTTDAGQRITVSEFGGKVLVLNFWASWCPPCIDEIPSLNAFSEQMRKEGVVVLGVSVDKNEQAYKRVIDREQIRFLTSRDPEASISADYGTFKYPETYIIDRSGKVVQKHIGPQNWVDPALVNSIRALL